MIHGELGHIPGYIRAGSQHAVPRALPPKLEPGQGCTELLALQHAGAFRPTNLSVVVVVPFSPS